MHSAKQAIYDEEESSPAKIVLEGDFRNIEIVEIFEQGKRYGLVHVGAGCNLGINPDDPEHSNSANSLFRRLDAIGFAVPICGGMSH